MKTFYVTRKQAIELAEDLMEYARMQDSHDRDVFAAFQIKFGDPAASEPKSDMAIEVSPISEGLIVEEAES